MEKPDIKSALRVLERERAKVAKSRDALRDLISELENHDVSWHEAVENLDIAIDRLSELV